MTYYNHFAVNTDILPHLPNEIWGNVFDHLAPAQVVYRGQPTLDADEREYCLRLSDLTINKRLFSVAERSWSDNTILKIYLPHVDQPTQTHMPLAPEAISKLHKIELYLYESHGDMCLSSQDQCLDQYLKRVQEILSTLAQHPQSKTKPRSLDVFFLTSQDRGRFLAEYHLRQLINDFNGILLDMYDEINVDYEREDFDDFADGEYQVLKLMVETRFAVYEDEAFRLGGRAERDVAFRRSVLTSLRKVHESRAAITRAARAPLACAYISESQCVLRDRLYGPDLWDKWAHDVPDKKLRCACRLHEEETEEEHLKYCSHHTFEQTPDDEADEWDPFQTVVNVERDPFVTQTLLYLRTRAILFQHGSDGRRMEYRPVPLDSINHSPETLILRIHQCMLQDQAPFLERRKAIEAAQEADRRQREADEGETDQEESDGSDDSDAETAVDD